MTRSKTSNTVTSIDIETKPKGHEGGERSGQAFTPLLRCIGDGTATNRNHEDDQNGQYEGSHQKGSMV